MAFAVAFVGIIIIAIGVSLAPGPGKPVPPAQSAPTAMAPDSAAGQK